MSRVFVVQEPLKKDVAGNWEKAMDLTPAVVFGDLEFLLKPGNMMLSTDPTVELLKEKLKDFNDDDFILPVGDPIAIAIVASLAAKCNEGRFKLLKWDGRIKKYIKIDVSI